MPMCTSRKRQDLIALLPRELPRFAMPASGRMPIKASSPFPEETKALPWYPAAGRCIARAGMDLLSA